MALVTYLAEVECVVVVPDGMLDTQVVKVPDEDGQGHTLRVPKGYLVENGGKHYLPVHLLRVDQYGRRAQVELPQEADSGTSRIWVPFTRFRKKEGNG